MLIENWHLLSAETCMVALLHLQVRLQGMPMRMARPRFLQVELKLSERRTAGRTVNHDLVNSCLKNLSQIMHPHLM